VLLAVLKDLIIRYEYYDIICCTMWLYKEFQ